MTDEYEPFVGDGNTPGVIMTGSHDRFEGHELTNGNYSICTWFYLTGFENGTSLYLIAMTDTAGDLGTTYMRRAPLLTIAGGSMYA